MDLSGYARFWRTPGVPRLFSWMLVGRLPGGMLSLAIVLRITSQGGSFRLAGAVTASFAIGLGAMSPVLSRLIDRRGQTVVLIPCAFATLGATVVMAVLPAKSAPVWLILAGALLGVALPPLSGTSRTMWPAVVTDPRGLESAYAADATFQELIFIGGPLLVVAVAAIGGSGSAIVVAGALGCTGTVFFATSRASRQWRPAPHDGDRHQALRSTGIRVLVVTMFALLAGFAAIEVGLIAAARAYGSPSDSGLLLAVWSLGSMAAGLLYGARDWPGSAASRVAVLLVCTAGLVGLLVPAHNLVVIGVVVGVSGAGGAPALAAIYRTVQEVALPGVVTESYAWLSVGTMFGSALGAAIGGQAVTARGPGLAFAIGALGVLLSAVTVTLGRHSLASSDSDIRGRTPITVAGF
jgi:hypothetical protein